MSEMTARGRERGLSLVELLVAASLVVILAGAALPLTKIAYKRNKEVELRQALRQIRTAIDQYKQICELHQSVKSQAGLTTNCYPPTLEALVEGVTGDDRRQYRFLRRVPKDPFYPDPEDDPVEMWGKRSYQQELDDYFWDSQNVYDVFSQSETQALDGRIYQEW